MHAPLDACVTSFIKADMVAKSVKFLYPMHLTGPLCSVPRGCTLGGGRKRFTKQAAARRLCRF